MIRVNRYPPCPLPEKCLGVGSHSDPHTLTILLQDDVGGLQVLKSDNQWIGIRPVPNSFVINIGDTLEVTPLFFIAKQLIYTFEYWNVNLLSTLQAWTNGRLRSVVHRAVVNKEKHRLSVAYFLSPATSAIIDCPPQLIESSTNLRKYVSFTWGEFRKELLTQKRVVGKTALNRYLISPWSSDSIWNENGQNLQHMWQLLLLTTCFLCLLIWFGDFKTWIYVFQVLCLEKWDH